MMRIVRTCLTPEPTQQIDNVSIDRWVQNGDYFVLELIHDNKQENRTCFVFTDDEWLLLLKSYFLNGGADWR